MTGMTVVGNGSRNVSRPLPDKCLVNAKLLRLFYFLTKLKIFSQQLARKQPCRLPHIS